MKLVSLSLLSFLIILSSSLQAQEKQGGFLSGVSFGGGIGSMSYIGDLSENNDVNIFTYSKMGASFTLEKRFGNFIGLSFDGLMGKVSSSQRSLVPAENLNFTTDIQQFGLSLGLHLDNDVVFKSRYSLSPYITVGAAYTLFDPYGDLINANGANYYYWSDGRIMDTPEMADTLGNAQSLIRDHEAETQLTDSVEYDRNTLAFPITFGLKWKLSNTVQLRAKASYVITSSDFIDNYSVAGSGNDSYLFTGVSILFSLKARDNSETEYYRDVDFSDLQKMDSDGDGVNDWNDQCANTVKGHKVNGKGCIADNDKDGVPNNIDKEPETAEGAKVTSEGVTIPEPEDGPVIIKDTIEN